MNQPSLVRPGAQQRYERRLEEVLAAAAAVFARRGYGATTIDDLVAATGLTRGGLYHYIESKDDLFFAIHQRFIDPLLAQTRGIEAAGLAPAETLRQISRALMNDIVTYHDHGLVFLQEWRVMRDEPRWQRVADSRREFERVILRTIEHGHRAGTFALADAHLAVLAFLGMFSYTYQWMNPEHTPPEVIADQFCAIFLSGIQTRGQQL